MNIIVDSLVRDEGTVVVFEGHDETTDRTVTFACDHHMAQDIVDALVSGEEVLAGVEPWQIIGRIH